MSALASWVKVVMLSALGSFVVANLAALAMYPLYLIGIPGRVISVLGDAVGILCFSFAMWREVRRRRRRTPPRAGPSTITLRSRMGRHGETPCPPASGR